MKHTPGPWSSRGRYVMDAHENVIAQTQMDDGAFTLEEAKANARFIAVAPDLLAMVKELRDAIRSGQEVHGPRIDELIARAEGAK